MPDFGILRNGLKKYAYKYFYDNKLQVLIRRQGRLEEEAGGAGERKKKLDDRKEQ